MTSHKFYICENEKTREAKLRRVRENSAGGVRKLKSSTFWGIRIAIKRERKLREPMRRDRDDCKIAKSNRP